MQTLVGVTLTGHPVPLPVPHDGTDARNKQDIGDILHQIMTITDQSLDEAQAKARAELSQNESGSVQRAL
ncbi:hypothetical protein cypCar_00038217 [Cyprinus carpio]|nr:hypothetical protein cypCar_00038217 [Cyprinus carpio]